MRSNRDEMRENCNPEVLLAEGPGVGTCVQKHDHGVNTRVRNPWSDFEWPDGARTQRLPPPGTNATARMQRLLPNKLNTEL